MPEAPVIQGAGVCIILCIFRGMIHSPVDEPQVNTDRFCVK